MDVESVPGSILWFQTVPWPDTCADPASHLSTTIWIECGFCFQMHHSFSGNNSTLAVFYHVTSLFIGNVCCVLSPLFIMFFYFSLFRYCCRHARYNGLIPLRWVEWFSLLACPVLFSFCHHSVLSFNRNDVDTTDLQFGFGQRITERPRLFKAIRSSNLLIDS